MRPNVPSVPDRYAACFQGIAKLPTPRGGWTLEAAVKAIAKTRASEVEKARCGRDLVAWANGTLTGIRGH